MRDTKSKAIVFTKHDDGSITVNKFPEYIEVTDDFMKNADKDIITCFKAYNVDTFNIYVANGKAIYKFLEYDSLYNVSHYQCIEWHLKQE